MFSTEISSDVNDGIKYATDFRQVLPHGQITKKIRIPAAGKIDL
ncbi:hypothetical protein CDEF62S_02685 [Castellaniella defragrans]